MVFTPPSWVPKLPFDPPDSIPIHKFWGDERYGRLPFAQSRDPFTCGVTGRVRTNAEMAERLELLARALAARLGWRPNLGTPWDKVVGVFSFNSIDYLMATFAVHRLSGIVTPANAMYSAAELEHQLRSSGAGALITCTALLDTALRAARGAGIAEDRVFIMDVAELDDAAANNGTNSNGTPSASTFSTLDDLIAEGRALPPLERLSWTRGQGARQTAYLCYSSGTSGLPKAVMVAHRNVIANMMQMRWHEEPGRRVRDGGGPRVCVGLLPLSHIYGLVVVANTGLYRGDAVIILPRFELRTLLATVQRFRINLMHIVPPIVIALLRNRDLCAKYDLSSIRFIFTGAAPLGAETHEDVRRAFPGLQIGQGYGMTETATVVTSTGENDVMVGTSGSLVPSTRAKIVAEVENESESGAGGEVEITEPGKRGELLVQSPSVTLGYLHNERATAEAFVHDAEGGRWMRTGDVAEVRVSPAGHQHFAIVDRIKELIKVKGHQVAPAELEAHLLSHPTVADCAVIPVPDEGAGEVPKAFVVRAVDATTRPDKEVAAEILRHVEEHKARYKWLKGGIEFIDAVPKSPSGKILRRLLKDRERDARKARGAKL